MEASGNEGWSFLFPGPTSTELTLLEAILQTANQAESGIGVFSFATRRGIDLLLDDPDFRDFLEEGGFELLIGVDAITTPGALERLEEIDDEEPNLTVKVFLHNYHDRIFHPKFSFFNTSNGGVVFVGSGNLTLGGLVQNWEAFGRLTMSASEVGSITEFWENWKSEYDDVIRGLPDEEARERAERNSQQPGTDPEIRVEEDVGSTPADKEDRVLVSEIPKSGDRWNQANFDWDTFETFFHLGVGEFRRLILVPLDENGQRGDPETRQGVSVESQNYRIELGQGAGIAYPEEGRPIGVFLQMGGRLYRYRLLMPEDEDHEVLDSLLDDHYDGPEHHVRRVPLSLSEFKNDAEEIELGPDT